jgi:hypothetical protein
VDDVQVGDFEVTRRHRVEVRRGAVTALDVPDALDVGYAVLDRGLGDEHGASRRGGR